jgi:16S rRNA (adenine1518-N6/adenine1519-N6)-dimethyltransferase
MKIESNEFENLIKSPAKLVSNLPYNIATALLLKLLPVRKSWESFTVMVQLEVGERLCAIPDSGKIYGPLSLAGSLGFEKKIVKIITSDCFFPSPKVDSCLIQLLPRNSGLNIDQEKLFLKWSHLLFQNRRKTLLNSIRKHYPVWFQNHKEYLREKYDMRRPETLDFKEWMNLFCNFLKNNKNQLEI